MVYKSPSAWWGIKAIPPGECLAWDLLIPSVWGLTPPPSLVCCVVFPLQWGPYSHWGLLSLNVREVASLTHLQEGYHFCQVLLFWLPLSLICCLVEVCTLKLQSMATISGAKHSHSWVMTAIPLSKKFISQESFHCVKWRLLTSAFRRGLSCSVSKAVIDVPQSSLKVHQSTLQADLYKAGDLGILGSTKILCFADSFEIFADNFEFVNAFPPFQWKIAENLMICS